MEADDSADVVGRRIGAGLLDLLAVFVMLVIVGLVSGEGYSSHGSVGVHLHGVSAGVWIALVAAYYFGLERIAGQTLGKWMLGLVVVGSAGGRPAAGAIAVRTLLRVPDFLPFAYLLGLLVILATGKRRQRLGDLAAGTRVVRRAALRS